MMTQENERETLPKSDCHKTLKVNSFPIKLPTAMPIIKWYTSH